jgi:hypothetical protein
MSHTAKINVGTRKGESIDVVCGQCCRVTAHEVLVNVSSHDSDAEAGIQVWDDFLTLQCRGCRTLSFCREARCTEDIGPDGQLITTTTLFPGRIAGRPELSDIYHLPTKLISAYQETRTALMSDLRILAGIGIRAIVETVCNDKLASGNDLARKIDGLLKMNLIAQTEADILHNLRFMGNKAAHEVKAHTQEELNMAFDVAEHLLKTVYLLPEQTKRLPSRTRKP